MNCQKNLIRIILLSLIFYAALSLFSASHELRQARALEARLASSLQALEEENLLLQQELEKEMSDEELAQLARQRLGLVLPGEKIFYFTTDRED